VSLKIAILMMASILALSPVSALASTDMDWAEPGAGLETIDSRPSWAASRPTYMVKKALNVAAGAG
jgi:hypothetical protein